MGGAESTVAGLMRGEVSEGVCVAEVFHGNMVVQSRGVAGLSCNMSCNRADPHHLVTQL